MEVEIFLINVFFKNNMKITRMKKAVMIIMLAISFRCNSMSQKIGYPWIIWNFKIILAHFRESPQIYVEINQKVLDMTWREIYFAKSFGLMLWRALNSVQSCKRLDEDHPQDGGGKGIYGNDMIWYDMILYDMIWYDMIWYDMILYDMIWYMI